MNLGHYLEVVLRKCLGKYQRAHRKRILSYLAKAQNHSSSNLIVVKTIKVEMDRTVIAQAQSALSINKP